MAGPGLGGFRVRIPDVGRTCPPREGPVKGSDSVIREVVMAELGRLISLISLCVWVWSPIVHQVVNWYDTRSHSHCAASRCGHRPPLHKLKPHRPAPIPTSTPTVCDDCPNPEE